MKNKKTKIAIIGVIALILVTIGITYAYWLITRTQTGENQITAGCLDIAISGEANDISLTNQFPMSDEDGMELVPYEFTVTNNCDTSVDYQVALEATGTEENAIATSSLKVALNDNVMLLGSRGEIDTTISGAYESRRLGFSRLAASGSDGSSDTYELRIWIDADAPIGEMNKTFTSKISVTVGQGIEIPYEEETMAYSILSNYGGKIEEADPSIFQNSSSISKAAMYKAQDDLGDSYYFRGASQDNYVQFGSYEAGTTFNFEFTTYGEITYDVETPIYWRIVRINGDGSIRLIYDGTELVENGVSHNNIIGYNNNPTGVGGYTYDTSSTDLTQNDSIAKSLIDNWYDSHIEKKYGQYIADAIFCSDRNIVRQVLLDSNYTTTTDPDAAVYITDYYGAYDRLYTNKEPSLKCTNQMDRYTVEDTTNGNGYLSNPVALINADEVLMAGGDFTTTNNDYYLYGKYGFYTMTPAYTHFMLGNYGINVQENKMVLGDGSAFLGMRPVINLNPNVEFTGNGTIDNPYKIVME